jgi:hypothetical protein
MQVNGLVAVAALPALHPAHFSIMEVRRIRRPSLGHLLRMRQLPSQGSLRSLPVFPPKIRQRSGRDPAEIRQRDVTTNVQRAEAFEGRLIVSPVLSHPFEQFAVPVSET